VVDAAGATVHEHEVEPGDIWRMCQVKDAPVPDWVKLAVTRARATGTRRLLARRDRAHDARSSPRSRLPADHTATTPRPRHRDHVPGRSHAFSLERIRAGEDTISVTGNVLRDYLTDLFPILELGTSAKMLSIVPLMNGGGLFETGAGGSAPKHVQQFLKENHLRWDSLGEFLALAVSFEHLAGHDRQPGPGAGRHARRGHRPGSSTRTRSPSRKVGELDNRGSHFYLALYWAEALAAQTGDAELAARSPRWPSARGRNEATIVAELNAVQGQPVDIGGYYRPTR
jgi:isocitrate dehydrogenase